MTTTSSTKPVTAGAIEPFASGPEGRARVWVPQDPGHAFAALVSRRAHWCLGHERADVPVGEHDDDVLAWEPARRLVLAARGDAGEVEIGLEAYGPGTVIELTHRDSRDGDGGGDRALDALTRHEAWVRRDELPTTPPTVEAHKQTALASLRAMSDGSLDIALAARLHTPDYRDHEAGPTATRGPLGVVAHRDWITGVYPDLRFDIHDVIGEDDKVVVRCVFTGTHLGQLFSLAPTGRRVTTHQIHILRFEQDRIAEHWAGRDHRALMAQLGQN